MDRGALLFGLTFVALGPSLATAAPPVTRSRDEIPAEYRWDFTPIYADWSAWEAGMKEFEAKMDAFAALKGTLAQGPETVLVAYRAFDEIGILSYRIYRYPQLQRDVDTRNQEISARFQQVGAALARFGTAISWFTPELLTIPEETMQRWLAETPALEPYRFGIEEAYRQQAHVLDEDGERMLSFARRFNDTPPSAYQELKFPTVKLSDGDEVTATPAAYLAALQTRYEQSDRASVFEAHVGTYAATANTYAALYNAVLQRDWFLAQARNYASTLEAALDDDAVPPAVVENLVATTRAGTAPLQRYARLRKRLLGLESYHLYDGFIPLFRTDRAYPYESAKEMVAASVAPLGEDYARKFREFVSGGRIDVYENEGKRSGAYSAGVYGVGPYQLLNYNDTQDALFTFAHEAGHAMHTVLSYENQPFATSSYTIFVAEVASTTAERFLLEHLLQQSTDPRERFLLLQHAIESIINTFYTQVLFADFELQAHRRVERGEPITAEVLNGIYLQLLRDYYGDAITVDELYRYTWTRISHFFNTPYYVYQYATCFASSAQLFREMTTGTPGSRAAATERYLELLKSGGNDQPMKQLLKAGVDLTKPETVQAVVDQLDELVTRLEQEAARLE